jgi:hypothetical protein
MPEGYPRAELISRYCYDVGITEKKAMEHVDLQIALGITYEDDLRIYWRGPQDDKNKEEEEKRNRK